MFFTQECIVDLYLLFVQVLAELKEYATEVDVDFVRKAVRAIGRCAIKVEVIHCEIVVKLLNISQRMQRISDCSSAIGYCC